MSRRVLFGLALAMQPLALQIHAEGDPFLRRTTTVRRALLAGAATVIMLVVASGCGANTGSNAATFNDADVAFAQPSEQCIHKSMQHHIGV